MKHHEHGSTGRHRVTADTSTLVVVAACVGGLVAAGCSSEAPVLQIDVTTGYEADAMRREPAVTRVDVVATSVDGADRYQASSVPGGSFDIGEVPIESVLTFEVTGLDATGTPVLRGRSLSGIYLAAVGGGVVPVFAQRTDGWARPPGALARAHVGAPTGVVAERYLVSTGGESASGSKGDAEARTVEFYDMFAYGGAVGEAFPRAATSMVARPYALLLVDGAGATWVDYDDGRTFDAVVPTGLASFGDVAGGATIDAGDGSAYVVGATRPGSATRAVLRIALDGTLTQVPLNDARRGAAAVWIDGVGLVVAGGSDTAPGVEILVDGASAFAAKDYPPDAVEGAGAVVTAIGLVLVGGAAPTGPAAIRRLDPQCSVRCAPIEIAGAKLPVELAGVSAFATQAGRVIVIGAETGDEAMTRTFLVDVVAEKVDELALREPRRGARAVPAPNGTLALMGGTHSDGTPALTVEMLFP